MVAEPILELSSPQTEKGVTTQHLWIAGFEDRRVPALVLKPEDAHGTRPVVLLGHGAGQSKDDPQYLRIARWLVRRESCAVALIDAPVHGERRTEQGGDVGQEGREALLHPETYETTAIDWQRTLDACAELPDVGTGPAAYLGFSMGTVLGVSTVSSDPRFTCAVFAVGGILGDRPNLVTKAAQQITLPVLMINQSEDEIFSREAAFRLFDALAGPKRLFFHPGAHSGVPREAMARVREFLHAHLTGQGDDGSAPTGAW